MTDLVSKFLPSFAIPFFSKVEPTNESEKMGGTMNSALKNKCYPTNGGRCKGCNAEVTGGNIDHSDACMYSRAKSNKCSTEHAGGARRRKPKKSKKSGTRKVKKVKKVKKTNKAKNLKKSRRGTRSRR